ncbi:hypothetical protein C4D60_Mb03t03510 [Musa balbisiana]|uniref:Uncharacterized protein n=1 Tax=Musa balbisiana TaxID=52838 RepID=A0A4V4H5V1_MUSBA|nr:hypothetical protein C4D60_Mb03t03510 [Musa balbisiana]
MFPQRALGRSVMRERLRVNRMLRLVGEHEAWTAAGRLPSEPSAHQILRLGSRVMRTRNCSFPVPPPKHSAAMLETVQRISRHKCLDNRLDVDDGLW